ncbi:NAD(P)-dependent oxidoreductase, partial [Halolamina salina]|uniref:NAD(P)-dependent oxidoreductase n=1 Tax=Halolamina salina TaxID=1220023 RepID=UPI00361EE470
HDAVVSALGPSEDEDPEVLTPMIEAVIEGMRRGGVDRLVWTGGAGILRVGPDTRLIETDDFPEEWVPVASAAIDAYGRLEEIEDIEWSYVAPAALIEPGERTGEYRTAVDELVTDESGDSYVSMEDFAIALVDELESGDGVHEKFGVGY